jgi:hypothetical protein
MNDSPHQNRKQDPTNRSKCSVEDDPKNAHSDPESFVIGFESVHEFIGLSACKRLLSDPPLLRFMHPCPQKGEYELLGKT